MRFHCTPFSMPFSYTKKTETLPERVYAAKQRKHNYGMKDQDFYSLNRDFISIDEIAEMDAGNKDDACFSWAVVGA